MLSLLPLLAQGGRLVATFATARTTQTGEREHWPLHKQAEQLVQALEQHSQIQAAFLSGPDSRQFNNVAIVVDKS